jgi:chromosomal replication initiator protein
MEKSTIWPMVLAAIEKRVNKQNFKTWFEPLTFIDQNNDMVYLGVPDAFTRDWIKDHGFRDIIQEEYSTVAPQIVKVVLRIIDMPERASELEALHAEAAKNSFEKPILRSVEEAAREQGLNPRYTFDHFVVGSSNQLAYAASMNVAENPAKAYNPLFIYGGAGLGKTHLLNAIGHRALQDNLNLKILYTSSETFVNELIHSIRTAKTDSFRNKFRQNCDLLLMDDIQFISGKVRTQEEFFHTFNTLFESYRQIVITSDRYPQEIPELEDRLRTRFQWGLIADIQPPEIETRIAILQKKADIEGLDIPDDVAMFIASSVKSSVREIEGSLKRLGAISSMLGKPITLDFAKDELKDIICSGTPLSIEDVQKSVCSFFNVKISDLKGKRRHRSISRPRQIAMYICRTFVANSTFPEIGNRFNKDHSTAISAVQHVEQLIKTDPSVREAIEAIKRQLGL